MESDIMDRKSRRTGTADRIYAFLLFIFRFRIREMIVKMQPKMDPAMREVENTKKLYGLTFSKKAAIADRKGKIHAIILNAKTDSS